MTLKTSKLCSYSIIINICTLFSFKIGFKMKVIYLSLIMLICSSFTDTISFPSATVKTLEGKSVEIKDYIGQGKITVVSFWATWCSPCKRELDAIGDLLPAWKEKYNLEVLAVTLDNSRGLAKVPAIVQSKGWEFIVLSDSNQALQQALGFQSIPQSYLLDGKGNIVYSHTGYSPGDEFELEDEIKKIAK